MCLKQVKENPKVTQKRPLGRPRNYLHALLKCAPEVQESAGECFCAELSDLLLRVENLPWTKVCFSQEVVSRYGYTIYMFCSEEEHRRLLSITHVHSGMTEEVDLM
jgi:hypothetical protein